MDVSRDLGIEVSNLNRWRKEYLDGLDQGHTGEGKSPSELAAENKLSCARRGQSESADENR
jgi:transposase-like protein